MIGTEQSTLLERVHSKEINWACYVPLIFSLFYFIPFVQQTFAWYEYVLMTVGYIVFVVLYTLCRIRPERATYYIVAMTVLVMCLSSMNQISYSLVWYAAYYAGYLYSFRSAWWCFVYIIICILISWTFTEIPFEIFLVFASLPCLALLLFGMFDQKIRREELIKHEKNKQIEQLATIAERERLTRDMHDVLGHNLTAICLKSRVAAKLGNAGEMAQALKEIEEIASLASTALSDVREAITQYKRRGFSEQLNALVAQLGAAGFDVSTDVSEHVLNANQETHLILVLTEAVTNILRHSNGDKVNIMLKETGKQSQLTVHDNGVTDGFKEGNGLNGIRERIAELNGVFTLSQNNGFSLQVTL